MPVYAIEKTSESSPSELYEDKTEDIIENTEVEKLVLSDTFMSNINEYDITNTQADAIAWAFTDYIWEEIQNEQNH